jgi:hypothetical protein
LKNTILAEAKKYLLEGCKIELVSQTIPDGEEVQIGWNDDAKAWIISCSNITIIVEK